MGKSHTPLSAVFTFLLGLSADGAFAQGEEASGWNFTFNHRPVGRGLWAHEGLYCPAYQLLKQTPGATGFSDLPAHWACLGSFKKSLPGCPPPEYDVISLRGCLAGDAVKAPQVILLCDQAWAPFLEAASPRGSCLCVACRDWGVNLGLEHMFQVLMHFISRSICLLRVIHGALSKRKSGFSLTTRSDVTLFALIWWN